MRCSLLLGVLVNFLVLSAVCAQSSVDPVALAEFIEAQRTRWNVPGLSVAIVTSDNVIFDRGFGTLRVDSEAKVNSDTRFAIASNTKAFCAATLALLVERGKLSWNDRVQKYLPEFQLYDPYVSADMTIRDLLCHRSGLGTFSGDLLWYGTPFSAEQLVQKVRYLKQAGPYREYYGYSNLMFIAAGEIVRRISGETWADFVRKELLEPLEMTRTVLSTTELKDDPNSATPHKTKPDQNVPLNWCNWDSMVAAGGIISSSSDMSKWLRLQLKKGMLSGPAGKQIFSAASAERMWSPHTVIPISAKHRELFPSSHFRAYGLGWSMMDYHGVKVLSHGGGYDGMYSCVMMVPESDFAVVVLTNSMTSLPTALAYQILEERLAPGSQVDFVGHYYESFQKERAEFYERIRKVTELREPKTGPSLSLADYCGTYIDPKYGEVQVIEENGQLSMKMLPNPLLVADLSHLQHDTFRLEWRHQHAWFEEGALQFQLDFLGMVEAIRLNVPNDDLWFDELNLRRVR